MPEMLEVLNEQLTMQGKNPAAFDHDCLEGICGMCGAVVDGVAQGPEEKTTLCQLHLRHFHDNQTITIEPFRARAFPVAKDLVVDRSALDRIIQADGFVSVNTGAGRNARGGRWPWSGPWTDKASVAAATSGNTRPCAPREISIRNIARLNREFLLASLATDETA